MVKKQKTNTIILILIPYCKKQNYGWFEGENGSD